MFDLRVGPIDLDVQQAVPVGLIINEAITNSFKYAFPFSGDDRITIRLAEIEEDRIMLTIADNGRGMPPDLDPTQHNSFGMLLIGGLTEDLDGDLNIRKQQGIVIDVRFRRADHLNK
jgi:two-component sensor histidine kinase